MSILTPRDARKVKELEHIIGKKFEKKQVPDGAAIYEKQVENFLNDIEQSDVTLLEEKGDVHLLKMGEKLKKLTKDELVKHIIAHKFNHVMENYAHARDLNTNATYSGGGGGRRSRGGSYRGGRNNSYRSKYKGNRSGGKSRSSSYSVVSSSSSSSTAASSYMKKDNFGKKKRSPLGGRVRNHGEYHKAK